MDRRVDRRRLLRLGVGLGTGSLAGCSVLRDVGGPGTADVSADVPLGAGWPTYGHDAANTGHADDAGPTDYGDVAWRAPASRAPERVGLRFPGAVVDGETAFVPLPDGPLRALSLADGSVRWKLDGGSRAAPAVADGVLYYRVSGRNHSPVRAVDAETGEVTWERRLERHYDRGGVTVAADTVYVGGGPRAVVALGRDGGRVRWTTARTDSHGPPALHDDRLFVATEDGLTAYDAATGERRWRREASGIDAPSVSGGLVVLGTRRDVRAFGLNGTPEWTRRVDGPVRGTPAIADDGVVVATRAGTVYALDADGAVQWQRSVGGTVTCPVAVAAGLVYVSTHGEEVVALSLADGAERWRAWTRSAVLAPPAVADGRVVVQDAGATATALRNLDGGPSFPDVGEWSLRLGDRGNTNRAPAATLPTDPAVRWRAPFDRRNGPVLVGSGRLFLGGTDGAYGLSAASGRLDWRYHLPNADVEARVLAVGRDALFAGVGDSLWAFEPAPDAATGTRRWRVQLPTGRDVTEATVADGTVYVAASNAGELAAVDEASGAIDWTTPRGTRFTHPPAVAGDHLYAGTSVGRLYAVTRDSGAIVGETSVVGRGLSGPVSVRGGHAVVPTVPGDVVAFDVPEGTVRWRASVDYDGREAAIRAPVALTDDRAYVLGLHGGVYAFDAATGDRLAKTALPTGSAAAPRVVDGSLLVGTWSREEGGTLHALDAVDLSEQWSLGVFAGGQSGATSHVVPVGDRVYVLGPSLALVR